MNLIDVLGTSGDWGLMPRMSLLSGCTREDCSRDELFGDAGKVN